MCKIMKTGILLLLFLVSAGCSGKQNDGIQRVRWSHTYEGYPVVYHASDVSPDGLLSAYEALEASFDGAAAIRLPGTAAEGDLAWTELVGKLAQSLEEAVLVDAYSAVDFSEYGCTIVLSHFKSHDTAGFYGAVKQAAAISAASEAACRLFAGSCSLEDLAKNGKRTADRLAGRILYINVVDHEALQSTGAVLPESEGIGILASYDPIALDQACIDMLAVYQEGVPLLSHIESCNGLYTLLYGEQIDLGSRTYALTEIERRMIA